MLHALVYSGLVLDTFCHVTFLYWLSPFESHVKNCRFSIGKMNQVAPYGKMDGPYAITLFDRTPTFEWYMASLVISITLLSSLRSFMWALII